MSEYRYDIRQYIDKHKNIGSCVDPNPLRVERPNPDIFPHLQTRERCALEIAAYVFKNHLLFVYVDDWLEKCWLSFTRFDT